MANNNWNNYTEKTATPVDADEVMVRDSTDGKNKKLLFGTFWKWVAKKLNEATISELQTSNKTIVGALNQLNSETQIVDNTNNCSFMKIGNIVFVTMRGFVAKDYIIPSRYIPNVQRTITGLISYAGENYTFVADCDIRIDGKVVPHYKNSPSTRIENNAFSLYGTAFYYL